MIPRPDPAFWAGRRVFLTGHTGFKGAWARLWLETMGAVVVGYALPPPSTPSLHGLLGRTDEADTLADIRDRVALGRALAAARPEIVIHMAAQALVLRGYDEPVETFDVNVMGTVNLLEAVRAVPSIATVVVVTTDKVYHNDESAQFFHEEDRLGGHDPYSASKAACELVVETYRASFLATAGIRVVAARGGNVIGGGDFSADRLVPDVVRAAHAGRCLEIRNPAATRPWQHVLDCLSGYFLYAEAVHAGHEVPAALNFGPDLDASRLTVTDLAVAVQRGMGLEPAWVRGAEVAHPREMHVLGLDPSRAAASLGWRARYAPPDVVRLTARWYAGWHRGESASTLTRAQIETFMSGE